MENTRRKIAKALLSIYEGMSGRLKESLERKTVPPGHLFLRQGDKPTHLYIFLEGRARAYQTTPKGTEYLMDIMGPGELAGEVEILTGDPYMCSVESHTACKVVRFSKAVYLRWLREDPEFSLLVNKQLCFRLRGMGTRAATHLSYPLEYSVLKLFKDLKREERDDYLDFSRSDLADYLGTSQRSINRVLKKLQENRVIVCEETGIRLLSRPLLEELLQRHE